MKAKRRARTAVVLCRGKASAPQQDDADMKNGDCRLAKDSLQETICESGCLGQGSCIAACRLHAIAIGPSGAAIIDPEICVGCGLCVKACPNGLIRIFPSTQTITPRCSRTRSTNKAKTLCASGCVACGICVKNCPVNAISVIGGCAVIDEEQCVCCGMCAIKCPRGVIVDADGILSAP